MPDPSLWRDLPVDADDSDEDDPDAESGDDAAPDRVPGRVARLRSRAWGRFAELWVPESLTDARVDPGRRGAVVLLIIATLAAIVTAVGVWRDRPQARPVESVSVAAAGAASDGSTATSSARAEESGSSSTPGLSESPEATTGAATAASDAGPIVVSVTGEVLAPGIVTVPSGARVADAIAAAGGPTPDADYTGLNLAVRLVDGASIVVGGTAPAAPAGGVTGVEQAAGAAAGPVDDPMSAPGLVNLNTAGQVDLDTLPGVGPVMAQNILAWRQEHGRFASVEQLQEISGIGPARYAQISALVTV